jgi:signal transduction histidine kinase
VDVDLRLVAERVIGRSQAVAAERGLRFVLSGPAAVVRGDPAMLERIVGNLVDNAVKHSRPDGVITLEIESGAAVALTVRDQGPGVPQGDQAQLFSRFFRGDAGHRDGNSTGLGLAIAKAAAEAHGGRLEFVGNDPGAVFRLILPVGVTRS